MRDQKNEFEIRRGQGGDCDAIDRALDAALAKYVAVPRAGIEERILANLQTAQKRKESRPWWQWPAVVTFAVLAVALAMPTIWHPVRYVHDTAIYRLPVTAASISGPVGGAEDHVPSHALPPYQKLARINPRVTNHTAQTRRAVPKLAQFPSLRPLSEQERLLVHFVQDFPEEAAMIAKAQAESEKELERASKDQSWERNSEQQDQQER